MRQLNLFPDEAPKVRELSPGPSAPPTLGPAEVEAVLREIRLEKELAGLRPRPGESQDEARQRHYARLAAEERRAAVESRRR